MNPNTGQITYNVVINTTNVGSQVNNLNSQLATAGGQGATAFGAKFGAIAGITSSIFNKAFDAVSSGIDGAISRVDTLNNSTRVFANMGFSAADTKKTMDSLTKSIQGLPTPLDSAVKNVQLLAGSTGDLGKSQQIFSALNDGILGFGGTTDMVNNSMVQLSQAFANGKVDAETWNSMMDSGLGPTLNALAKQMGMTTGALKDGLSSGAISVQQFQDGLINLDKNGGGGMASLQKIVKDSTAGIGTNMENMQTSISRGLASIIQAIGQQNIANLIANIGTAFETALKAISSVITFVETHQAVADILKAIAVALAVIGTGMLIWNTYQTIMKAATAVQIAFNAAMAANPLGIIILALVAVTAALIYFFTQTETGKKIVKEVGDFIAGVWDWVVEKFKAAWEAVKTAWAAVTSFFTGLWNNIVSIFTGVGDWFRDRFQNAWNNITAIFNGIGNFFAQRWENVKSNLSAVGSWFRDKFQEGWNAITNIFSNAGGWFRDRANDIVNAFSNIGSRIAGFFSGVWEGIGNGLKNILNSVLHLPLTIPKISVAGQSFGGQTLIPRLATGGIVSSPTTALIGEAGPEAVIPLSENSAWMDALAKKVGGGGPTTINLYMPDGTKLTSWMIDAINDRTRLSGNNSIMV